MAVDAAQVGRRLSVSVHGSPKGRGEREGVGSGSYVWRKGEQINKEQ